MWAMYRIPKIVGFQDNSSGQKHKHNPRETKIFPKISKCNQTYATKIF